MNIFDHEFALITGPISDEMADFEGSVIDGWKNEPVFDDLSFYTGAGILGCSYDSVEGSLIFDAESFSFFVIPESIENVDSVCEFVSDAFLNAGVTPQGRTIGGPEITFSQDAGRHTTVRIVTPEDYMVISGFFLRVDHYDR